MKDYPDLDWTIYKGDWLHRADLDSDYFESDADDEDKKKSMQEGYTKIFDKFSEKHGQPEKATFLLHPAYQRQVWVVNWNADPDLIWDAYVVLEKIRQYNPDERKGYHVMGVDFDEFIDGPWSGKCPLCETVMLNIDGGVCINKPCKNHRNPHEVKA